MLLCGSKCGMRVMLGNCVGAVNLGFAASICADIIGCLP